ncbi:MAG TPA: beta-ketoacyl synthase N-terminal-like domain-containing protein, partial [Candidatus Acidoferrales bacterium]|nr:beta-ketoacyl synthase N-terminal-like domain-containing protein [Candidatus Acidoferrales bacterium]
FIYEPRFRRLLEESNARFGRSEALIAACDRYYARRRNEHQMAGPYTLAGIMPNVASGRVAQMYNVNGPNLVIGEGDGYDGEFLAIATQYLAFEDADAVICGALNLEDVGTPTLRPRNEGMVVFCVTTPAFARANDLEIIGTVEPTAALAASAAA